MKILLVNGEQFQAEKIVKTNDSIIGFDINGKEIFLFKGITDFSRFQLKDENGNLIDIPVGQNEIEILHSQIETMQGALDFIILNY